MDERFEQTQGDAVRVLALELTRTGTKDAQPSGPRPLDRRADKCRLADPGLAFDDDEPAVAFASSIDHVRELAKLRGAL